MVKAMLTHQYTYAYGAVSPMDGKFDSLVLPHNTECMQLFITEIASRYPQQNIVMVLDGAGWHKSTTFVMPENLQLHFCRRTRRNSIPKSTFGMSCGRSTFTTKRLTAWTHWRNSFLKDYLTSNSHTMPSNRSPVGIGY